MQEMNAGELRLQPFHARAISANYGDAVARLDNLRKELRGEIAAGDQRKLDAAKACEEAKNPAVANAEICLVVEMAKPRNPMHANNMVDIGRNNVRERRAARRSLQPVFDVFET